ncbi:MAG: VanW family protein [Flexilinea sp.]
MQENTNHNQSRFFPKFLFTLLCSLTLGILFFFAFITIYSNNYSEKIFEGISVSGIPVGGLTKEEADQKLRDNLKYPFEAAFAFTHESDIWHAIPEELGMQIQFDATLEKVWAVGRSKDIFENIRQQLAIFLFKYDLEPVLMFDERVAFNFINSLAGYIDEPLEQPEITLHGSEVIITPGKAGKAVDKLMTMTQLQILGRNLQTASIEIPVTVLEPTASNLEEQKEILESLLGQDFILYTTNGGEQQQMEKIPADTLAGWINFEPVIEGSNVTIRMVPKRDPFYNRLVEIGVKLYQEPKNARFVFNDDTRIIEPIAEAVVGEKIDIETTLVNITNAIQAGQHQAEITMVITPPAVTSSANGKDLGIIQLVESQYTYFYGSDAARIQNITTSAASFHGILVAPGETFSMADYLGDIDINNGYAEAPVIFGDETIQGVGGGICQVSTTLFRTAFLYGLPIVERHQHAYRVFYYERVANGSIDPSLSGLDASVYIPILDLKFTNDTPYWILMETYVNPAASSIQWKFYSTDVNRYVDWETTGPTNITPPESPMYRENSALESGVIEQVDYEVDGADVTVNRTVFQDGNVHIQDVFETRYKPWQAIFEYGPNTEGMPPEEQETP